MLYPLHGHWAMHFAAHSSVRVVSDLHYLLPHGPGREVMPTSGGADSIKTVISKSCSNKMKS